MIPHRLYLKVALIVMLFLSGVVVANAAPFAYITNWGGNTVSVIDTATHTVIVIVPVGSNPHGVAIHPDGTKVYVTNFGSNTVSVIDTATHTVIATVTVGSGPIGVAIHPDGSTVYVANEVSNTVSIIDTASNTVTATVTVGSYPYGVAVHPDGRAVYVANELSYTVSVIDTATNTVTATVPVGSYPRGVAVHPDGSTVYVANHYSNTVSVIDTATRTVTDTVPVGSHPVGVAVHPSGSTVYVANAVSNTVSVIDTATYTVTATLPVGSDPYGVAVHPSGSTVYVANALSNTVSVIDTATYTVTDTVPVGSLPQAFGLFIGPLRKPAPSAHCAVSPSGTIEGWSYGGHADGIPDSLAGPFISTYDGVVFAELGPNGEAVWKKSTKGDGWLCKELQIPPLPPDGSKIYLTFWYDWVASAEDGVPPGGMEIFLDGKSRFKLEPTGGRHHSDQMMQWDVSEYAGRTVPFEVKYWFKIVSHGFGPTTGFWAEFIGVSLNMLESQKHEENTSRSLSGEGTLVMINDQRAVQKGEEFFIDVFGEIGGVVWFDPTIDPPLRIAPQPNGAYRARISLLPQTRYMVTEEYKIGITSLGMVDALHPVSDSYRYTTRKKDYQFLVTWTIANISVEISGDDVEGSASDLTANWLQVKAKAKRDIKLGEVVRGRVKYSATWIKRSSIQ